MAPEKVSLCCLPTPVHRLLRLSDRLGVDLWVKRDDLTGFAMGGNKGRKLEYLLAQALAQKVDCVVTCGSVHSNFVRQTGAACAVHGIECHAAVMHLPYDAPAGKPHGEYPSYGGNEVLDHLLGVHLHHFEDGTWEELFDHASSIAGKLRAEGKTVMEVPVGGSSPLGAYSFFLAGHELRDQLPLFDWIVTPTSSGSTHAGLAYAFHGTHTRVIGVACDPEPAMGDDLERLCAGMDEITGLEKCLPSDSIDLRLGYVGPGYNVFAAAAQSAIELLARVEGVFLDPVYSAKAFSGLLDLVDKGELRGRGLFWHTGGLPTLLATSQTTSAKG